MILGMMGAAGSGKSTVATYLSDTFGAKRYSFADPLKQVAMATLDFSREQCYGTQAEKEAIDPRYGFSPRWFLQKLGTEGCRKIFGDNFWCEMTLQQIRRAGQHTGLSLAIIEDVRFVNEARAIRTAGGLIWRLECPDRETATLGSLHASETEWMQAPYDRRINAPLSPGSIELLSLVRQAIADTPSLHRICQATFTKP